jgi:hypothetical protein
MKPAAPLLALAPVLGGGCAQPAPREETRCLEDQEGRRWPLPDALRGPAVILLGTPGVSATSTRWDLDCLADLERRDGVPVRRFLDLSGVPRLFEPVVKEKLRGSVDPPGTPILLDWKGEAAGAFGREGPLPAVILIDGAGREVFRSGGSPDPAKTCALRASAARVLP